jgi:hypothetical protein
LGLGRFITHTMFGRGASDYGTVPVPGSQQLELPAGQVYLIYQESKKSKVDFSGADDVGVHGDVMFAAPPGLQVSVTPVGGGPPLAISPRLSTNTSTKKGQSRDAIGSVEITTPGTYTVTAGPELPDAIEPQILVGS